MSYKEGLTKKLKNLRKIYQQSKDNGILIKKQNNISWLLGGRTHVNLASVDGVVELVLNDQGLYLISNNIEAKRVVNEEFQAEVIVKNYPWYDVNSRQEIINELLGNKYIFDSEVENQIVNLRIIFTEEEKYSYRNLGKDVAEIMEGLCFNVIPGMSENLIASLIMQKCMERGIEPIISLVAADERIYLYRHPLPTNKVVKDYVMIVIAGRRDGQSVGITRFVSFTSLTKDLIRKRDAVLNLDAMLLLETRPGKNVKDIFAMLIEGYKNEGFDNEWRQHHQGGLTGYNTREYKVIHNTNLLVEIGQAYSWNPSITGFKAEDTFIVEKDNNDIITNTTQLPNVTVIYNSETVMRPDILIRKQFK